MPAELSARMTLPRWDPFRMIVAMAASRQRGNALAPGDGEPPELVPPPIEVRESAEEFVITVALPAVSDTDVRVDIVGGGLQLHLRKDIGLQS